MSWSYDEKKAFLLQEGLAAVKNQDWDKVTSISYYNSEIGALIIECYEDILPLEIKCEIALYHYSNHGDFYPLFRKYVRKAVIIRPKNWREELPVSVRDLNTFTIYRGGGEEISKAAYSLSWTLSQEVAEWFMNRHGVTHPGPQHLYKGIISADKVIAYLGDREEYEIV